MNNTTQHNEFFKFFITLYFCVLFSVIILSILITKGNDVLFINGHHNFLLDIFFSLFTNLGDGVIFFPVILITLFIRFRDTVSWSIVALVNGSVISLFKRILFADAGRPITYLDRDLLHFVPGVDVHSYSSFPSGHTATIFAFVTLLSLMLRNRNATFLLALVALLVGYSRIYLLQHFLMDVAIGATIGSLTSIIIYIIFTNSRNLPTWLNGRIQMKIKWPGNKGILSSKS